MSMKFSFTLDDEDLKYFQRLLRDARKYAKDEDSGALVRAVRKVVVPVPATFLPGPWSRASAG